MSDFRLGLKIEQIESFKDYSGREKVSFVGLVMSAVSAVIPTPKDPLNSKVVPIVALAFFINRRVIVQLPLVMSHY